MKITSLCALTLTLSLLTSPLYARDDSHQCVPAQLSHSSDRFTSCEFYPQWSQKNPALIREQLANEISITRRLLEKAATQRPEEMSFESTFGLIEACDEPARALGYLISFWTEIDHRPEVREAYQQMLEQQAEFIAWLLDYDQLWEMLQTAATQPWMSKLSREKQRYIHNLLDTYAQHERKLSTKDRARLKEIRLRLQLLEKQFAKNVQDSTHHWKGIIKHEWLLSGMDSEWKEYFRQQALDAGIGSEEKPQWLLSLNQYEVNSILRCCTIESTRHLVWEARERSAIQAPYDNTPLIKEILKLRQEQAELFHYKSYADYAKRKEMLPTASQAITFLEEHARRLEADWQRYREDFFSYTSSMCNRPITALHPRNLDFFMQMHHDKNTKEVPDITSYFPLQHVLQQSFDIFEQLFGIHIIALESHLPEDRDLASAASVEVWDPLVMVYAIHDAKSGQHLGSFYLDLFEREGKSVGTWTKAIRAGMPSRQQAHLALLTSNISYSHTDEAQLFPSEIETFFHEMGHILHIILADTELKSNESDLLSIDFLEMPSQLLERWGREPEILRRLSKHVVTGEPITDELLRLDEQNRNFQQIRMEMQQVAFALLDLKLHHDVNRDFKDNDLYDVAAQILAPYHLDLTQPDRSTLSQFQHIFGITYAGRYHNYLWADQLAHEAFQRFRQEGLLNSQTGRDLRESILRHGSSKDAIEMYRDFVGRDPRPAPPLSP